MKLLRHAPQKARIEIIPMIDTVFFLLVFFMMASLSMAVYRGMPVNLPTAASGQHALQEHASLTVTQEGRLYLNKQSISLEALPDALKALLANNPNLAIILNADEGVPHGRVVEAMDAARGAGVGRLAIAVKPAGAQR
ncbi:MAG: biopolymer transporter ExbD [Candidatus Methylomirabilota bacterium]|nr:biopolymer transporter ExbD [candidate division NC10 bacterium]PWB47119.1 MAG: biopolymer transporter ExbD [candidate division NC10 bacterium]